MLTIFNIYGNIGYQFKRRCKMEITYEELKKLKSEEEHLKEILNKKRGDFG